MLDFETELKVPKAGSTVLCWDTLWLKNQNPEDKLRCHGKVGLVLNKATPSDLDQTGHPLGRRADECFLVMFASEDRPSLVHGQWLKVMDEDVN